MYGVINEKTLSKEQLLLGATETFMLNEGDSIEDLNVDEFKSLNDLENAGYYVLRLDNGKFVTDYQ